MANQKENKDNALILLTDIVDDSKDRRNKPCPSCGYQRQPKDDDFVSALECPKCGIVYSKYAMKGDVADRGSDGHRPPSSFYEKSETERKYRLEELRKELQKKMGGQGREPAGTNEKLENHEQGRTNEKRNSRKSEQDLKGNKDSRIEQGKNWIECPNCGKRYKLDPSRIPKITFTARCKACGHIISVGKIDRIANTSNHVNTYTRLNSYYHFIFSNPPDKIPVSVHECKCSLFFHNKKNDCQAYFWINQKRLYLVLHFINSSI